MTIDNSKRYRATVTPVAFPGDEPRQIEVCSTTNTPASSYGLQQWCDREGRAYGQIDLCNLFAISDIREVSEAEAEAFFDGD